MKRLTILAALVLALAGLVPSLAEESPKKALTLMVYMCGSNLESQYGSACADIEEMQASGVDVQAVNVLLLTGGSAAWHTGQDAGTVEIRALRYSNRSGGNRWEIEQTLPARSMGDEGTLVDYIDWSVKNYPAEKYALILWDHGAGPLEGICLDELNAPDRLSIGELAHALGEAPLPGKLSWIGMDACLMATAEVAKAMAPYAEYMIASQETEPANGWDYAFLKGIEADGDGAATGRRVVDAYFESQGGDAVGLTLSCLDLSHINEVAEAMNGFFEPIGRSMDNDTFARLSALRTQSASFGKVVRGLTADGYDLVDLGDLINHYGALGDNHSLRWALASAVTYKRPESADFSGLSVYHPLRNKAGYRGGWKQQYAQLDFSEGYQKYLNSFGTLLTGKELADWSQIALSDDGFSPAGENLYSLQLTPLQRDNFASAQLILLGAVQSSGGSEAVYDAQLSGAGAETGAEQFYYPVLIDEVSPDEAGVLSARYTGRSLYLTDESGNAVAGPIGYQRSDDGEYWYIRVRYYDHSGREDAADSVRVLYTCALDETGGALKVVNTEVYDPLTQTYTRRIGFDEADYTEMDIDRLARSVPEGEGALPGFADWKEIYSTVNVALPLKWQLRFFDEQLSGTPLFATLQITDVQQNSYCTPPIRVENPNLYNIDVLPRQIAGNGFELTLYAVQDSSPLSPGLNIGFAFKNTSHQEMRCEITDIVLNGHREASGTRFITMSNVAPGKTAYRSGHLDRTELAALGELTELSFELRTNLVSALLSDETRSLQSVRLSGCDASVMGSEAVVPLAETVRGEATWQLLELRRNARGGLSGTLRVVNDGDKAISESCYIVLNDCLQTDEEHYFVVDPHMDVFIPFEVENSVYGDDLTISTEQGNVYRYMGIDHLMERFGITEVTSLKLCYADSDTPFADSIAFELAEPIPVADPGEAALCQPLGQAQRLLLDGDFAVNVDRLLVVDDGVALRLLVTNRTGRDLKFGIRYPTFNGENAYLTSYGNELEYAVGAGATLVANLAVEKGNGVVVDEMGLCFRYGNFTTHSGSIMLDATGSNGGEGVTYLSGADIRTTPADNARSGIASTTVAPASVDIDGASLSLSAALTNDGRNYSLRTLEDSAVVTITLRAENMTEDVLRFDIDNFVVNGTRSVSGSPDIYALKPGEGGSCSLEIEALELAGLDRVSAVDCQVTVQRNGVWDSRKAYPLHFDVPVVSLAGFVPELGDALGEGKAGDISLRLLSLREDGDALKGLLYLRNDSDVPLEEDNRYCYVNGIRGGLVTVGLPGRTDRVVGFTYDNRADASYAYSDFGGKRFPGLTRLLQRMGMDAVESVGLLLDENSPDGMATATLETPLPLSPCEAADMAAPKPLLEGEVSVGVTHAIMMDDALCLTLVLRNDSPERQRLEICGVDADGCAIEPYMGFYYLAPGATQVSSAILLTGESMRKGKRLEAVNLSFAIGGELAEGAVVRLDGPMTLGRAELRNGEAFEAAPARPLRPMPAIFEAIGVPEAQNVYSAQLVAPVDALGTARFDHGEAVVCVRGEETAKDEAGETQKRPCLREVCRIPLAIDGGRLVAPFSGMALWQGNEALLTRQTPLEGGGTELRVGLALSPRTAQSGEAASSDQRERDTLEGRWTVDAASDGPVRLDGGWTPGRPDATGDPATLLAKDWDTYGESTLYFGEGVPDVTDRSFVTAPNRMTLVPVQTLDAAFAVRYEIFYKDGDSETITVDDDLAALWQAAAARRADMLGELEPDGYGSIAVTPDMYQADRFRVSVSARLMLEDDPDAGYADPKEPQIRLGLCARVENPTDLNIDAVSTNLVLNGAHETDTKWMALQISPGSACVDTWYIEPEDLRAVGSIQRIQCTLNLSETGKDGVILESIPIDVELPPMDEAALWQRYGEVGETGVYGVTWQLLSAEVDQYGRVSGMLNAVNHTNSTFRFSGNAVLANGYRGTSVLDDFELEPHSSKSVRYAFENFAWTQCREGDDGEPARKEAQTLFILQSHGVQAVTELTFDLGMEYDSHAKRVQPKQTLAFELPGPLAVPPTDYVAGPQKLLLQEGGLSVWLESVLLGDENLSIALEVRNDTDELYALDPDHVCLDGNSIYSAYWEASDFSTVLPHTVQNCCFSADLWDYEPSARSAIRDIHLCFWVEDGAGEAHVYRAARVRLGEAPAQTGDVVRAGDCEVRPAAFAGVLASGLTDELVLPPADSVRPRTLTPPISGEKAALFESGEAYIGLRQAYDEYDYPDRANQELTREIVSLPLERDADGAVSARYSGMALGFWHAPYPMREQTRGGESEISATFYLLRDYYDTYDIRDPGNDGGSPDVVPVGAPSYVADEVDVPVPSVKVELRYRLEGEGDALTCRREKADFIDMATGQPLDGGVPDWMYHSMMICNVWGDDCDSVRRVCWEFGENTAFYPCMLPIERLTGDAWNETELVIRYHLRYADGTEENIVAPY